MKITAGQRKHMQFIEQLLAAGILCWFGLVSGDAFVTLQTFAFGLAIGGNAAEHFASRGQKP